MSLLMQALKKAEHAKQQQTDAAGSDLAEESPVASESTSAFSLAPIEPTPASSTEAPAHSGDPFPELSTEISPPVPDSQHIAPLAVETPQQSMTLEPAPAIAPAEVTARQTPPATASAETPRPAIARPAAPPPESTTAQAAATLATRRTAQSVFAAKQPRGNRRRWQLLSLVIIVVLAAAMAAAYFYLQQLNLKTNVLPPSSANQGSATNSGSQAEQAAQAPAALPEMPSASTIASAPASSLPQSAPANATPSSASQAAPTAAALPKEKTDNERRIAPTSKPAGDTGSGRSAAEARPPATTEDSRIEIRQTTQASQVNPTLAAAYQAFMAGDTKLAQKQYQQVLKSDARNRDALLGLAAIAMQDKQTSLASSYYLRLLELDPADPEAIAGLTSLQNGNPEQSESRLKKILAEHPQAGAVHFVLGNIYAQQLRWSEAQQSYFLAYSNAPTNADYAFNLAVSLDRLGQNKLALDYYQRALGMSQNGPHNFTSQAVQSRIKELRLLAEK